MKPMMHPAITIQERLTLRNLVLMVRKSQIAPPYRKKEEEKDPNYSNV